VDVDVQDINDSSGIRCDVMLKEVAARLSTARRVDTICRTGRRRVLVVLPEIKRSPTPREGAES